MSEEIARQWLDKAYSDLLNVDNNLQAEKIPFDTVCFHCQQAAEKILKSYLIAKGHIAPRTHDLFLLLEQIIILDEGAEYLRDFLAILMPYAVEIRYPDDWFMPSKQDALEARDAANRVLIWFKQQLPWIIQKND